MDNEFEIPVVFKEEEIMFPAKLLAYGYTHKIQVDINGITIIYEPDEERNYRAFINVDDSKINIELVKLIAQSLHEILA